MGNIFEEIAGKAKGDEVQMLVGPWWCHHGSDGMSCFEVDDEASLREDGFVYWTCEQGHKNKEKING